jgi:GNAT superfamily N-acetyltransferase
METEITAQEGADEADVRPFLDAHWQALDPEPWTTAQAVIRAERGGELIGVATCTMDAGVAHLSELMVAEGERNGGLGARLLAAFEEWAARHGAHKLTLHTRHHGPAQPFYERHGWRVAYVMERHYLHQDYAAMVKVPHEAQPARDAG